jgi:hypothetical protein
LFGIYRHPIGILSASIGTIGHESQAANFFGLRRFGVAHVAPAVVAHGGEEQHRGF